MNKQFAKVLAGGLLFIASAMPTMAQNADSLRTVQEAKEVIDRFTGGKLNVKLDLSLKKNAQGCDSYSTEMKDGQLIVKGSSGVALCRGAYAFIKENGGGMRTWQGQRFSDETLPSNQSEKTTTSPFRDHYYLNVVTYGYTMPYWDEKRWDEEIDWMALHGVDMPLSLVGQEAVYRMVFRDLGLTDDQIDAWEVGPAHLPWMRMGNLAGNSFDGPLTRAWDDAQIKLQKHILERMRALGMKPIFPAFGGFVPPAYKDMYPSDVTMTGWGWVPNQYRNYRLSPSNKKFVEIGTKFIEKWESIFGKGELYLSDSFNEMAIPNDKALLTQYGDSIYKSITNANAEAKWVMQGWTVGYQRGDWGNGNFEALIKNVPNDKFMLLDMATDYNKCYWNNGYDWDFYPKFYGKEWVWSVIPNMGGKTAMTGKLEYYANGRLEALSSANKGNLTGYGFAPEGVENNEMIYELLCDGGWTTDNINLDEWMTNYAENRYGDKPDYIATYYDGLLKSVYNSFTDHPRFGWQTSGVWGRGSVNENTDFKKAVETMFDQVQEFPKEQLLKNDLIEAAALYTGAKVEDVLGKMQGYIGGGQIDKAKEYYPTLEKLMLDMDRALSCHTLYGLDKWEQHALDCATTDAEKEQYARNARRIVSVWYGNHTYNEPVADYAARLWSGMIRDYYWPRVKKFMDNKLGIANENIINFENEWVKSAPALSAYEPVPADTLTFLKDLVNEGKNASSSNIQRETVIKQSNDFENTWYNIRSGYDPLNDYAITQHGDGNPLTASMYVAAGEQMWRFIHVDGADDNIYYIENRYGSNISDGASQGSTPTTKALQGRSSVKFRVVPTSDNTSRWLIKPSSQDVQGLHVSSVGNLTTWTTVDAEGSTWILELVPDALVPEAVSGDYERYLAKLEALKSKPVGQAAGQPKSMELLLQAIETVTEWSQNINHEPYNTFLNKWANLWKDLILTEEDIKSGIFTVNAEDVNISVKNESVLVNGSSKGVKVFTLSGKSIPNRNLSAGIYVVTANRQTFKVSVL